MEFDKENIKSRFSGLFKEEKFKKIIIVAGFAGIALIFISNFFSGCTNNEKAKEETVTFNSDISSYKEETEKNLEDIVSSIDGAGNTRVYVTVDSSTECIYAANDKNSITENRGDSTSDNNTTSEKTYITVRSSDGTEQAVLLKQVEPKIRGVLVLCSGGENKVINGRVLEAVTKALNISSAKVCVTKLSY